MRQSSEDFMNEILKDNETTPNQGGSFEENLANMIDQRLDAAMQKFTDQFKQIIPPTDPAEAAEAALAEVPEQPAEPLADQAAEDN